MVSFLVVPVPTYHVVTLDLGAAMAERRRPPTAVVGVSSRLGAASGTIPVAAGPAQNI